MRMEMTTEVFDRTSALASVGGDREFLSELVGLFQAAWPTLQGLIRAGLAEGNLHAVERSARLVKAAANNVSAKKISESASTLEIIAHEGALEAARAACATLEGEVVKITPYLTPLRNPKDN